MISVNHTRQTYREDDRDMHIVLQDPADPGEHMVVESDDPDFRGNVLSPYRDRLAEARHMFEDLQRQSRAQDLSELQGIVVRVTGVGFFDMNHFQVGPSPELRGLHPFSPSNECARSSPEGVSSGATRASISTIDLVEGSVVRRISGPFRAVC